MKIKKALSAVLVLLFALTSCSNIAPAPSITSISDLEGQTVAIIHTPNNSTPEEIAKIEGFTPDEVLVCETINEALSALKSDRAKAILDIYKEEADFFMSSDEKLSYLPRITDYKTSSLSMLARASDSALVLEINAAIEELRDDGTLEKLVKDYISSADENTLASAPSASDGGDSTDLCIGISGQWPPFDYITPNGEATGFNVALSTAVADKLGRKVQFVTIPPEQKFTALMSDRIDLYFFHAITIPTGESYSATSIYYSDSEIGCLVLK